MNDNVQTYLPSPSQDHELHLPRTAWAGTEPRAFAPARFIEDLFSITCPPQDDTLENFVAHAMNRTQLSPTVLTASLVLLLRLKTRFPKAKAPSGHRLFLSALMIAQKSLCDANFSAVSWAIVARGRFPLEEINRMEKELLDYLAWRVNVTAPEMSALDSILYNPSSASHARALSHVSACLPSPPRVAAFTPPHATPIPAAPSRQRQATHLPSPETPVTTPSAGPVSTPCPPSRSHRHPNHRHAGDAASALTPLNHVRQSVSYRVPDHVTQR